MMNKWGKRSKEVFDTLDPRLQGLANTVLQIIDVSLVEGERTDEYQFGLFKRGRKEVNGSWVIINKNAVVTYKDGYEKKSTHQTSPSIAFDMVPAGVGYSDKNAAIYMAGIIWGVAYMMGIKIRWGGDWDRDTDMTDQSFMDYWHWELVL